jgi:hypothetical protein
MLTLINEGNSATISMTMSTSKPSYYIGEQGVIWGNMTFTAGLGGGLIPDALVSIEVDKPDGNPVILRTRSTGSMPTPLSVRILNVTPCDLAGNPVYFFANQSLAHFEIALVNLDPAPKYTEITLNIFDSRNVPYEAFTAYKGMIFNGTTTLLVSDPVPQDISPGNATVYADAFSGLPSTGGCAYCLEQSAVFTISGNGPVLPPPEQPPSGFFNLTFLIDNYQRTRMFHEGNYTVSTNCQYQTETANATATFAVALRGDANRDGVVDIYDAIILAGHYNEHVPWKYPAIDPLIDFNGDGSIDIYDAIILAANFGKTA